MTLFKTILPVSVVWMQFSHFYHLSDDLFHVLGFADEDLRAVYDAFC